MSENTERKDIFVQYMDVYGDVKEYLFTDVTEIAVAGSGDGAKPWYVLIGQRPEGGNDVLEKVIRVENEHVLSEPLPRSQNDPAMTFAEERAHEQGYI